MDCYKPASFQGRELGWDCSIGTWASRTVGNSGRCNINTELSYVFNSNVFNSNRLLIFMLLNVLLHVISLVNVVFQSDGCAWSPIVKIIDYFCDLLVWVSITLPSSMVNALSLL